MKKNIFKILIFIILFHLSSGMANNDMMKKGKNTAFIELLYDDVWGTIYNAEAKQCDKNPTITGDGSYIDINKASELRWIAISQEMLDCSYRQTLLKNNENNLYMGKIMYGDTVYVSSSYTNINGMWVVHDTKNKRYSNSIDFLQTLGDSSLFNNDKTWSGKFDDIKIYRIIKYKKLT